MYFLLFELMYYPGNKNIPGLIQKIVNQIPACTDFYEPFAGSAAVSNFLYVRSRNPVQFFINDLDLAVTDKYGYPAGAIVSSEPATAILWKLISVSAGKDTFVFLDPPYLQSCRPRSLDLYRFDMTVEDHLLLFTLVRDLKCNCMLIHPECDLYNHALKSFRKVHVTVRCHNKTSREILYMNYPEPARLLTYDMVGSDCWDRQRIKRKGDRLIKKIQELPVLERNYLLDRISNIN